MSERIFHGDTGPFVSMFCMGLEITGYAWFRAEQKPVKLPNGCVLRWNKRWAANAWNGLLRKKARSLLTHSHHLPGTP
jgi:hypothetical protein